MVHTMPTKALLATTLRPLVVQLSSSLAHGARLIAHFLHQESTPQKMATFERALRTLLQEVGRRIMAWVALHQKAGQNTDLAVNEDNLAYFRAKKWV